LRKRFSFFDIRNTATLLLFAIIYSLISIVNHYYFRTYSLDLGLYTNALYKYANFSMANSSMVLEDSSYLLGGHFDLYLILFSPLVYIFGTYTLLIVQIFALLVGAAGVFQYFSIVNPNNRMIPWASMLYFLLFYGVYSALAFDYHSVVVAASIIPWFFYFFKIKKLIVSFLIITIIVFSQENISVFMFFICVGLLYEYRKEKTPLLYLSGFAIFCLTYFIVVIYIIIPMFSTSQSYTGFLYSALGGSPHEVIITFFSSPLEALKIPFYNHINAENGDYIKLEFLVVIFISGLWIMFRKPWYLFMLIPLFFQKLYHDMHVTWGIGGQYSIEFAPIMAIGIYSVISKIKKASTQTAFVVISLLLCITVTIRVMDNTIMYTNKSAIRFYSAKHYQRDYDVKKVHRHIKNIPSDAAVSAQSPFVPHLSLRSSIYQFPIVNDAKYIVLSPLENTYPLSNEEFGNLLSELSINPNWELVLEEECLIIYQRIN